MAARWRMKPDGVACAMCLLGRPQLQPFKPRRILQQEPQPGRPHLNPFFDWHDEYDPEINFMRLYVMKRLLKMQALIEFCRTSAEARMQQSRAPIDRVSWQSGGLYVRYSHVQFCQPHDISSSVSKAAEQPLATDDLHLIVTVSVLWYRPDAQAAATCILSRDRYRHCTPWHRTDPGDTRTSAHHGTAAVLLTILAPFWSFHSYQSDDTW